MTTPMTPQMITANIQLKTFASDQYALVRIAFRQAMGRTSDVRMICEGSEDLISDGRLLVRFE
ncbi:MAG: hypothetical protein XE11_1202 [Methanomicrobiales archaeon 53_19]|jgi:hypothetical protein|nr:MAG: hypothetical protein XE11_1202 [Methanomicrobiales archaeon 53_19]